jgi:hypothetical protein
MANLSPRTRKWLLIGVLFAVAIAVGLSNTHHKEVSELDVYTRGAERMMAGEEVYRNDEPKPFTYPPAFALPFVGFHWIPQSAHRTAWFFVNLSVFLAVFLLLRRLMLQFLASRGNGPPRVAWIWLVVFLLAGRHVAAVFENQSHDLLVLLVVMLGTWFSARTRDSLAGAAFGIGAAFKATPLLFAPILFWQRRFVAALAVIVATAGMLWLPDLIFPRADGGHWVLAWYHTFVSGIGVGETAEAEGAWSAWNFLNQNLGSSLYRLLTPVSTIPDKVWDVSLASPGAGGLKAITLILQVAILAFIAWSVRPRLAAEDSDSERSFRRVGEAGLVACGMVLLSPMSSKAHFCVLIIAMLFTVTHYFAVRRDVIQLLLLICVLVTGTLTMKGLVGTSLGNEFLARGSVCWSTVLVLLATGRALRLGFGGGFSMNRK